MKNKNTLVLLTTIILPMVLSSCSLLPTVNRPLRRSSSDEQSKTSSNSSGSKNSSRSSSSGLSSSQAKPKTYYDVFFQNINGVEIEYYRIEKGNAIPLVAIPKAPSGKVPYGWMNVDSGQIWDFTNDTINAVYESMVFRPCYYDESNIIFDLEAEFCPIISEANNGQGMEGATYSGGMRGAGMIGLDENGDLDASNGAYVHYLYQSGNTLTWEIDLDSAEDNATIFARFSSEYGNLDESREIYLSTINDESFTITVNSSPLNYGKINFYQNEAILNPMPFRDYMVGEGVSLKAGRNIIEMTINNYDPLLGYLQCTAPVIDCIKIAVDSNLTWSSAKPSQVPRY